MHSVEPVVAANFPAGHGVQEDDPKFSANFPGAHVVQALERSRLYPPLPHTAPTKEGGYTKNYL